MLFDTHAHLDTESFDADRDATFARAHAAGVTRFLNPAYDRVSSARAAALAQARADAGQNDTWAAVGLHPNSAMDAKRETGCDLCDVYKLASMPRVVAIGEIGLDYHWDSAPREIQMEVFVEQLTLAHKTHLPVIIHCRNKEGPTGVTDDAYVDLLAALFARPWLDGRVLLHAYAGNPEQAQQALDHGYLFGIGGPLTYPRNIALRQLVQTLPLEHLVLETDAPYLSPQKHRGRRNEPAYVAQVALKLAELRELPLQTISEQCSDNSMRFFSLSQEGV